MILLDERALTVAVRYISRQARRRLHNPNLYRLEGAEDYEG